MVLTMVFGGKEAPRFTFLHNDPMVIEMKIASAIVQRILIDTGSFVDIITWDYLKKLTYPGRDIVRLVHPILGFGGQEVNPTGMIRLHICFGDKIKAKNLEVDFLVVDVPMAYNVILGHPTLHKLKVVIAAYLLQRQFETDDGSVGVMHGDRRTVRECYLVSIRPMVERAKEHGPDGASQAGKRRKTGSPPAVPEALDIHTLGSAEPSRP